MAAPDLRLARYSRPHLLQSPAWGQFKANFGWTPVVFNTNTCSAQVLFKTLPLGYTAAYLPKGPYGTHWQTLWPDVERECRQRKAVFLQVEPDLVEPYDERLLEDWLPGFSQEESTIQPRGTILIDLSQTEEQLLAAMKQKTRYNIRLALKKGVVVSESPDIQGFYEQMQTTGSRDGFAVHDISYFQKVYEIFSPRGECVLLTARHEGRDLAFLMLFLEGNRSWYFYGASDDASRNLMPTYLLQWEAMRWAKAHGAQEYDLWGIPDASEAELEAQFTDRADGLWGVYRFKRGFGGQVARSAPAYIKVFKPLLYRAYTWLREKRGGGENAAA